MTKSRRKRAMNMTLMVVCQEQAVSMRTKKLTMLAWTKMKKEVKTAKTRIMKMMKECKTKMRALLVFLVQSLTN